LTAVHTAKDIGKREGISEISPANSFVGPRLIGDATRDIPATQQLGDQWADASLFWLPIAFERELTKQRQEWSTWRAV
jgi:hypothetical protein